MIFSLVPFLYTFKMTKRIQRFLLQQKEYAYKVCFLAACFDHAEMIRV
jgi:hypothetical protein